MTNYFVYIMTNKSHTVLYTGFTDDLERRVYEHKNEVYKGFTSRYKCKKLIYYEEFGDIEEALHREKQLKRWRRSWKEELINKANLEWLDLYELFL